MNLINVALGTQQENTHHSRSSSGLDQAEKGSVISQEAMSDDDVFQLEKRAFFSKVRHAMPRPVCDMSHLNSRDHGLLMCAQDVAVCYTSKQV